MTNVQRIVSWQVQAQQIYGAFRTTAQAMPLVRTTIIRTIRICNSFVWTGTSVDAVNHGACALSGASEVDGARFFGAIVCSDDSGSETSAGMPFATMRSSQTTSGTWGIPKMLPEPIQDYEDEFVAFSADIRSSRFGSSVKLRSSI